MWTRIKGGVTELTTLETKIHWASESGHEHVLLLLGDQPPFVYCYMLKTLLILESRLFDQECGRILVDKFTSLYWAYLVRCITREQLERI